jgi:hypothetical protein
MMVALLLYAYARERSSRAPFPGSSTEIGALSRAGREP